MKKIRDFLERAGLVRVGEIPRFEPLAGGVSSDIWLVRTGSSGFGTGSAQPKRSPTEFCVKQALSRLRVAAEWRADVSRNANEVRWLTQVARVNRESVPAVLASDAALAAFAMEYLPPDRHELWKAQLARGDVTPSVASTVGRKLAAIHSAFAASPTAAADFDTGTLFHALRIEPYLLATARAHPDLARVLEALAERTARTRHTVVHGDVSPKNIMLGPRGPIFLDAECAWFGDPAFDLAFCLNHLLLKTLWVPSAERELMRSFDELAGAYLEGVNWEPLPAVEARAAQLLPALFLARVDGKSPVEYLTDDASKDAVRRAARAMLQRPVDRLRDVRCAWEWRLRPEQGAKPPSAEKLPGRVRLSVPASTSSDRITKIIGRRVWDSRGRPTVEADVVLVSGVTGRAIAPAGASTGINEAVDLRDGGRAFGGFGVDRAVGHVSTEIANALYGMPVGDQEAIDRRLIELDGTSNKVRLGANAIVAVSMAALHAATAARGMPLWQHLAEGAEPTLPMPMVQIFGGGAHAGRRVDIQDFLVVPVGASRFDEAISMAVRIYESAGRIMTERGALRGVADEGGWWPEFSSNAEALETLLVAIERADLEPGVDAAIALDIAASQMRTADGYRLDDRALSCGELVDTLLGWCRKYPIVSIEDPVAETDHEGMRMFTALAGEHLQIIGDDYLVTSSARITAAQAAGACNAVLLKPNQAGTITETKAALDSARAAGWSTIISARSGETEDVTIVHLAVGWAAGQLKVGSCARAERTAKWNEALRIEQALGDRAKLGGLPIRTPFWTQRRS